MLFIRPTALEHGDKRKDIFEFGESVLISGKEPEYLALSRATIEKITGKFIIVFMDR